MENQNPLFTATAQNVFIHHVTVGTLFYWTRVFDTQSHWDGWARSLQPVQDRFVPRIEVSLGRSVDCGR